MDREVSRERIRSDEAEAKVQEILAIPEIKQMWEDIKQFNRQINNWITEAHLCGLDPTDEDQRKQAANSLIGKVNWKGTTPFAGEVAEARTRQLSDEMIVTKEIVAGLLLAAGGKGLSGAGGGGSNNDLSNWDGSKNRSGWGR